MIEAKDTQIHKIKGPTSSSSEMHPKLENLVEQYEDLFHGLGKVVGCEHKVTADENVKPIAQRLRRIPFAMLDLVKRELEKMEEDGIIEKNCRRYRMVFQHYSSPKERYKRSQDMCRFKSSK